MRQGRGIRRTPRADRKAAAAKPTCKALGVTDFSTALRSIEEVCNSKFDAVGCMRNVLQPAAFIPRLTDSVHVGMRCVDQNNEPAILTVRGEGLTTNRYGFCGNQRKGDDARLGPFIDPIMDGAALHQYIARFQMHGANI